MAEIEDIDSLYDFIGYVVVCAPDNFPYRDFLPPHEQMTLDKAFAELRGAMSLLDPSVATGNKRKVLSALLDQALDAYRVGETLKGAHLLQDFQDLIFARPG